nr:MAG TPA: hypothetical protein [Caudoviricetes sp.]
MIQCKTIESKNTSAIIPHVFPRTNQNLTFCHFSCNIERSLVLHI